MAALDIAVSNMVRRARAGDQNAMALLSMVRRNAAKGNARAQATLKKALAYVKANPPSQFGQAQASRARSFFGIEKPIPAKLLQGIMQSPDPAVVIACIIKTCQCRDGVLAAIAVLANGPAIKALRVTELASAFAGEEDELAFRVGASEPFAPPNKVPPRFRQHMALGRVVGTAHNIQAVRAGAPIHTLSPRAAWELGERQALPAHHPKALQQAAAQAAHDMGGPNELDIENAHDVANIDITDTLLGRPIDGG